MLLSGVFEAVLSSQQMAQELVWDGGGLRLPGPLSLSLLLSPPPACSSCPGSSWSPDGRQFLLRADLSCPVALASLGWGPEILVHNGFSTGSWPYSPTVPGRKNSWVPISVYWSHVWSIQHSFSRVFPASTMPSMKRECGKG